MKTLIIYATKHGFAEKCSKLLKDKLSGEVTTVNIKKDTISSLSSFDKVIIGGSIYMGRIQKEINTFCTENLDILKDKKIGLFICGMQKDNIDASLNNSFPPDLLNHASVKESFGGEFILKNMNPLERFIIKMVAKTKSDVSSISEESIDKLARIMDAL
ncbi:flavodoxin domain-containing protein [Clostridium sp.]|jgi:menaquinone-dependent protoporphyrinogen oxidase|uniref:flavodoxin domain-containing protein n=1 Tax=Clostridium sp. TaxID=1506 RepID=UPI002587B59E|nr:flavodoxin domain-containing protein [Clostridium sp.]MDF2503985.1 flavodoxin [Clostridium sp.]